MLFCASIGFLQCGEGGQGGREGGGGGGLEWDSHQVFFLDCARHFVLGWILFIACCFKAANSSRHSAVAVKEQIRRRCHRVFSAVLHVVMHSFRALSWGGRVRLPGTDFVFVAGGTTRAIHCARFGRLMKCSRQKVKPLYHKLLLLPTLPSFLAKS